MKLNATIITTLFSFCLLLVSIEGYSQDTDERAEHFNLQKGIALKGFDPVTFFTYNKAVRANGSISYSHKGVKYFFASNNNLATFKENPKKYEAQYGGWCAYNMSKDGKKVTANPQFFAISSDNLFFFHSKEAKLKWLAAEEMKKVADDNWGAIISK